MMVHFASGQAMFRSQMQNASLQKVISQVNATVANKGKCDIVELSQKTQDLLNTKTEEQKEVQETEPSMEYQKHPAGLSKTEWAKNALSQQRDGIKTVSDVIDYTKSKLKDTMSKINELENYLNGTGTHSDLNMTKELAEAYLNDYKQNLQSDYSAFLQNYIGTGVHGMFSKEYDELSGGLASNVIENQLDSISIDSLGLSNLSDDPDKIMEALENASNILKGMTAKVENAYAQLNGGQTFTEPARSSSIVDGNSSLSFFDTQMEKHDTIVDAPLKFNGPTLNL